MTLLSVEDLRIEVSASKAVIVEGVSFAVERGEFLAVVGESGSGKTAAARAVLGLLPTPLIAAPGSSIRFRHTELVGIAPPELRRIRGALPKF